MLYALLALIALVFASPANAQVHVDIGIHLPAPPPLVVVPGVASVQYAPAAPANVFFYSGQYWFFANGGWHVSRRHEGPWILVAPQFAVDALDSSPGRFFPRALTADGEASQSMPGILDDDDRSL